MSSETQDQFDFSVSYDYVKIIVTRKEIVWIQGPFSKNFQNMSAVAGWSFTEGTDLFRGAPGCR